MLFVLFLWHPRTKGALYIYDQMLSPALDANEHHIDAAIAEWRLWMAAHVTNHLGWCAWAVACSWHAVHLLER